MSSLKYYVYTILVFLKFPFQSVFAVPEKAHFSDYTSYKLEN